MAKDTRARRILELCGRLFLVERYMSKKEFNFDNIKETRNRISRKITNKIKSWLDTNDVTILPKKDLGKAVGYMRKNWKALLTYMEEGYLSMHNNLSERQIRKIVLGRANWIFCGSEKGAERSAMIYSFICTCRLLEIDPYKYLNDVVKKIIENPEMDQSQLTPIEWKKGQTSPT
jgi:hypothetical protein